MSRKQLEQAMNLKINDICLGIKKKNKAHLDKANVAAPKKKPESTLKSEPKLKEPKEPRLSAK